MFWKIDRGVNRWVPRRHAANIGRDKARLVSHVRTCRLNARTSIRNIARIMQMHGSAAIVLIHESIAIATNYRH